MGSGLLPNAKHVIATRVHVYSAFKKVVKLENTVRTSSLVCLWVHKVESDPFCDIDEKLVNMTTVIYIDLLTKNSSICIIVGVMILRLML